MKKLPVIFFTLIIIQCSAQNTSFSKITNYYNAVKNFNGVLLVATNGQIDYLDGKGISNRQSGTTVNSKSVFKIASITKTFTVVMVLQLMEEGKLNLKATIGKYFPEYTGEARDKTTIENLITYSSGIPNCESYINDDIYLKPMAMDSFIVKYCSGKLEAIPGTKFNYDNGDYVILGKIIEKLTGKIYTDNLQDRILKPLGMQRTGMLFSSDIITGLVPSYTFNDSLKLFNADKPYYIENFFSAGAMYSSAEDLLKFDQGIFTNKLLKKETVDLMLQPHPTLDNVGLGFWTSNKYGALNTKFAYRPGGIYGASANWIHIIDSNRTIIVLSNTNATNLFEMSQQANAVATKQQTNIPELSKTPATTTVDLNKIKGRWEIDLRPGPNSEIYLKDFIILPAMDKSFSGEFYGTSFSNGKFNTEWDQLYFAFTTTDKENIYYHSGYIDGDKIFGISYSPGRKFISHWTGVQRPVKKSM